MSRHPHADLIHAYAEGAEIQVLTSEGQWVDTEPTFDKKLQYRLKTGVTYKEGWINIGSWNDGTKYAASTIYPSKSKALASRISNHVATAKVEWEE